MHILMVLHRRRLSSADELYNFVWKYKTGTRKSADVNLFYIGQPTLNSCFTKKKGSLHLKITLWWLGPHEVHVLPQSEYWKSMINHLLNSHRNNFRKTLAKGWVYFKTFITIALLFSCTMHLVMRPKLILQPNIKHTKAQKCTKSILQNHLVRVKRQDYISNIFEILCTCWK